MTTITEFDPAKYSGEWYEIAKYPFKWESKCDRSKAIYKWDSNHRVLLVENQCFVRDKLTEARTAKAVIPNLNDPGKLLIQFDGFPRDLGPGNYWIHWTDYHDAIVGSPDKDMLWWLSRDSSVKASDVDTMLRRIRQYGYDTERLLAHPSAVHP